MGEQEKDSTSHCNPQVPSQMTRIRWCKQTVSLLLAAVEPVCHTTKGLPIHGVGTCQASGLAVFLRQGISEGF